jgi:hypothetical protein
MNYIVGICVGWWLAMFAVWIHRWNRRRKLNREWEQHELRQLIAHYQDPDAWRFRR